MKKIYLIFIALIFMIACNSTPQVIENNTKKEIVKDKFRIYDNEDIIYEFPLDSWLIMFGIWIAEGWINNNRIEICHCKERVKEALYKNLQILGIIYKENIQSIFIISIFCVRLR